MTSIPSVVSPAAAAAPAVQYVDFLQRVRADKRVAQLEAATARAKCTSLKVSGGAATGPQRHEIHTDQTRLGVTRRGQHLFHMWLKGVPYLEVEGVPPRKLPVGEVPAKRTQVYRPRPEGLDDLAFHKLIVAERALKPARTEVGASRAKVVSYAEASRRVADLTAALRAAEAYGRKLMGSELTYPDGAYFKLQTHQAYWLHDSLHAWVDGGRTGRELALERHLLKTVEITSPS